MRGSRVGVCFGVWNHAPVHPKVACRIGISCLGKTDWRLEVRLLYDIFFIDFPAWAMTDIVPNMSWHPICSSNEAGWLLLYVIVSCDGSKENISIQTNWIILDVNIKYWHNLRNPYWQVLEWLQHSRFECHFLYECWETDQILISATSLK